MIGLPKPNLDPGDVFDQCISRVRNPQMKANLRQIRQAIVDASDHYDQCGHAHRLNEVPRSGDIGDVPAAEMVTTYQSRMVKDGQPGRPIYDRLRLSSPNRRCPLCNQRAVTTLDHFLPKENFSAHAVNPWNLVPSCSDCNKLKLAVSADAPEGLLLHPYYDDVSDERWLFAAVEQSEPAVTKFEIRVPVNMPADIAPRIERQFQLLGLGELYSTMAANELVSRRYRLAELLRDSDPEEVREYLSDEARSAGHADNNSWIFSTLEAWSESDWFCQGGFSHTG